MSWESTVIWVMLDCDLCNFHGSIAAWYTIRWLAVNLMDKVVNAAVNNPHSFLLLYIYLSVLRLFVCLSEHTIHDTVHECMEIM